MGRLAGFAALGLALLIPGPATACSLCVHSQLLRELWWIDALPLDPEIAQLVQELLGRVFVPCPRLTHELVAEESGLEEAEVRCRGIRCALESKLEQCREAEKQVSKRFDEITELTDDAQAVGLSIHSGAHMTLFPRVVELLREAGA